MFRTKILLRISAILMLMMQLSACQKPPGPGGKASIKGKVYAYDFDNTQRYMLSKGYSAGEKVYISYGTTGYLNDNVTTSEDGSFIFKYLTKGKYRIFVNSLDTSIKFKGNDTKDLVMKEVNITGKEQTVTLEDIVINK